jgi:hypothetical protein
VSDPPRAARPRSHAVGPVRIDLEAPLMPEDYERALIQMKRDLALTRLKRCILDPSLDAGSILALTEEILALQEQR